MRQDVPDQTRRGRAGDGAPRLTVRKRLGLLALGVDAARHGGEGDLRAPRLPRRRRQDRGGAGLGIQALHREPPRLPGHADHDHAAPDRHGIARPHRAHEQAQGPLHGAQAHRRAGRGVGGVPGDARKGHGQGARREAGIARLR